LFINSYPTDDMFLCDDAVVF